MSSVANSRLWHVPRLHAKVYLADATRAIVTSGNLTAGALFRNVEYGLDVSDPRLIAKIEADMAEIRFLGVPVQPDGLREYARVATKVRETNQARESDVDPALRQTFLNAMRTAEDELVRLRLAGGAMHTVFAKTVVYLLGKHGPLPTPDLHALVQEAHPDLCDDGVDRVIDGKSYGKKWKHAVRTAQQQAKRSGLVGHDEGLWFAT